MVQALAEAHWDRDFPNTCNCSGLDVIIEELYLAWAVWRKACSISALLHHLALWIGSQVTVEDPAHASQIDENPAGEDGYSFTHAWLWRTQDGLPSDEDLAMRVASKLGKMHGTCRRTSCI